MMLLFSDMLYMLVRYESPSGPMFIIYVLCSSSPSCHQTFLFHCSAHSFPKTLNAGRSSKEQ